MQIKVAVLPWQLWAARNELVWNDEYHTSRCIGTKSLEGWQIWNEVYKFPRKQQHTVIPNSDPNIVLSQLGVVSAIQMVIFSWRRHDGSRCIC